MASPLSITINADRSVFFDGNSPTSNYDFAPQLDVGEYNAGSEKRRSLVGFTIPKRIKGCEVVSATFRIYLSTSALSSNNRTIRAYRVKRAWVENQCTWNIYATGNNWGTAGCSNTTSDRDSTAIGTRAYSASEAAGYKDFTLTASLVQGWLDETFANNGIILISDSEVDDMQRHQGSTDANPPQLVINYKPTASSMLNMF